MGFSIPTAGALRGAALFLDFDGTLVDLTTTPEGTQADAPLQSLLDAVATRLEGRLAIVSGRSIEVLRGAFGFERFWLVGSHGLELAAPNSAVQRPALTVDLEPLAKTLDDFIADKPGIRVERKTLGVGLHFRLAPQFERACAELMQRLATSSGLWLQPGKMMLELRPGGANKGTAIAALLEREPFVGARPFFLGDDLTDEPGFEAVEARGGVGVLIGPERTSAATHRLDDASAVRALLASLR